MTDPAATAPPGDGPTIEEREHRLRSGAADLLGRARAPLARSPHLLLAASAALMVVGIVAILLAWFGIARSTMVEEQLAYLVSGGLLGLALATIGGLTFFSHWLTVLIRSNQEQTVLLREVRDQQAAVLREREAREEETDGVARSTAARRPVRRAPRGS